MRVVAHDLKARREQPNAHSPDLLLVIDNTKRDAEAEGPEQGYTEKWLNIWLSRPGDEW